MRNPEPESKMHENPSGGIAMTNRPGQHTLKRESFRVLFLFFSCGLTLCFCAQAQVYYVSKSGSDSNSGSASAPWLTIGHAALEAKAGSDAYFNPPGELAKPPQQVRRARRRRPAQPGQGSE
jgi:hypothetical protein